MPLLVWHTVYFTTEDDGLTAEFIYILCILPRWRGKYYIGLWVHVLRMICFIDLSARYYINASDLHCKIDKLFDTSLRRFCVN